MKWYGGYNNIFLLSMFAFDLSSGCDGGVVVISAACWGLRGDFRVVCVFIVCVIEERSDTSDSFKFASGSFHFQEILLAFRFWSENECLLENEWKWWSSDLVTVINFLHWGLHLFAFPLKIFNSCYLSLDFRASLLFTSLESLTTFHFFDRTWCFYPLR